MLNIRKYTFNPYSENTYILDNGGQGCLVMDPGAYSKDERKQLSDALDSLRPAAVLLTHAHLDHIASVAWIQKKFGIKVYMSAADRDIPAAMMGRMPMGDVDTNFVTTDITDGEVLSFPEAGLECKVITTPGHSPGGVCYLFEEQEALFTGDTLFRGTIGRSDLPMGEYDDLICSVMDKIMGLPGSTEVFPGHSGRTTIAEERTGNPFLQPFNEPEEDTDPDGLSDIDIKGVSSAPGQDPESEDIL